MPKKQKNNNKKKKTEKKGDYNNIYIKISKIFA